MPHSDDSDPTSLGDLTARIRTGRPAMTPGLPKTLQTLVTDPLEGGPSGPPPALPEPTVCGNTIVSSSSVQWLRLMRWQKTIPAGLNHHAMRADLVPALEQARKAHGKATKGQITKVLGILASTFQVSLPDTLAGYELVLGKQPYLALKYGIIDLIERHEYPNRLPSPAEIVKACARYRYEIEFWHGELERVVTLLEKQP